MDMNTIDDISILDTIQKVEAPLFLLTRIRQKIEDSAKIRFSPALQWMIGIACIIVMVINTIAVLTIIQKSTSNSSLAQAMNLLPTTSIYNE
jgi:hypothetical protein